MSMSAMARALVSLDQMGEYNKVKRMAVLKDVHSAGKSTLFKLLTGELTPSDGQVNRNGRLRLAYFAQHHIDQLDLNVSPVAFLQQRFPGKSEQEYRGHLGAFGITGMTGLQLLNTLSGGQKSRVTFAALSLQVSTVIAETCRPTDRANAASARVAPGRAYKSFGYIRYGRTDRRTQSLGRWSDHDLS